MRRSQGKVVAINSTVGPLGEHYEISIQLRYAGSSSGSGIQSDGMQSEQKNLSFRIQTTPGFSCRGHLCLSIGNGDICLRRHSAGCIYRIGESLFKAIPGFIRVAVERPLDHVPCLAAGSSILKV